LDEPLLRVRDLSVKLPTGPRQTVHAVRSVNLDVGRGERVGIVGESGSGKSVTVRAISGLLPESRRVEVNGSIRMEGEELVGAGKNTWQDVRLKRVGMIFQDPMSFLNPTMKVGAQIRESLDQGRSSEKSTSATIKYMEMAGLAEPQKLMEEFPFQLSGGMRQRVLIAIALAKCPDIIVADEPTTALDATIQRRVLRSLDDSVSRLGTSLLLITHDLAVVAGICDRVYVMFRGEIVESGTTEQIFYDPQHAYTKDLLRSVKSFTDGSAELYVSKYS
jgi:ABC-type dipeptide/oligopeptide/nickel transport system ATPase component